MLLFPTLIALPIPIAQIRGFIGVALIHSSPCFPYPKPHFENTMYKTNPAARSTVLHHPPPHPPPRTVNPSEPPSLPPPPAPAAKMGFQMVRHHCATLLDTAPDLVSALTSDFYLIFPPRGAGGIAVKILDAFPATGSPAATGSTGAGGAVAKIVSGRSLPVPSTWASAASGLRFFGSVDSISGAGGRGYEDLH